MFTRHFRKKNTKETRKDKMVGVCIPCHLVNKLNLIAISNKHSLSEVIRQSLECVVNTLPITEQLDTIAEQVDAIWEERVSAGKCKNTKRDWNAFVKEMEKELSKKYGIDTIYIQVIKNKLKNPL